MTTTETITFLRQFNRWRRGDDSIPQPQPGKAGAAIDAACAHIQLLEQELRGVRDTVYLLRKQRAIARNFGQQMERERDQWRECAEMFAKAIETLWRGDPSAAMEGDALAEFDRLKEATK